VGTSVPLKNDWTWLVCGLDGIVKTTLNKLATNQSIQYVLNDTSQFTCDVPTDYAEIYRHASNGEPFVSYNQRLLYGLRRDGTAGEKPYHCRWGGIITILQDQAESDEPVTHLTAHDPWTWAKTLPVLNPGDGSLPGQKGVTYTGKTGNFIAKDVLANAYAWIEATWGSPFPWLSHFAPDALFIALTGGDFETTAVIPSITFQQGTTVGDAWTQLAATGTCDIVLTPRYAPREDPGVVARLNVYNQAGGVLYPGPIGGSPGEKPGAVFGWDMFPRNLTGIDDLLDGTQLENWAQFFAGGIAADHASSSVSIGLYGPYFVQKNYSGPSNKASVDLLALAEVALRKRGKQTLQINPAPELAPDPFRSWYLGDTIAVWAGRQMPPVDPFRIPGEVGGSALRHQVRTPSQPSNHRVYGFQVDLADDQVETISNVLLTDPGAID
jgi:hypothetical protein